MLAPLVATNTFAPLPRLRTAACGRRLYVRFVHTVSAAGAVARATHGPSSAAEVDWLWDNAACTLWCEVVEWATPPSIAELEAQFGKFHFGRRDRDSFAATESGAPPSAEMER